MSLSEAFRGLLVDDRPAAFDEFAEYLDQEWMESALASAEKVTIRRRAMPLVTVMWLVVGMGLFRNISIAEVAKHLGLSRIGGRSPLKRRIASSSIAEARDRLGCEPMEWLFGESGSIWADTAAEEHPWHGLSLYAVDGTVLNIPDTPKNREAFGLPGSSRGQAGYPQVRVVALAAVRSHILAGAAIGPCKGKQTGEQTLAKKLWTQLPDNSIVILDKGFLDYAQLYHLHTTGERRHWLLRARKNLRWEIVREIGNGDYIVDVKPSARSRKEDPALPSSFRCRAICYQADHHEPQWLLTSLVDAEEFGPIEIARLYHERWEVELCYDEVKTHQLESEEALRSKLPQKVRQEIWGTLIAYNLVRRKMMDAATTAGVEPTRVSFTGSLRLVRMFCELHAWAAAPTKLPQRISELEQMIAMLILPQRRADRRYKRHVKIKMSKFKRNPGQSAQVSS